MAKFRGGSAFRAKLQSIAQKLSDPSVLRVGFLENSTYPDGTPTALVAAVQEFGSPANNIPPRPFFRNMIASKSKEWGPATAVLLKKNDFNEAATLNTVGQVISEQLADSIIATNSPPLAAATIAAKSRSGSSAKSLGVLGPAKPLVDTGHMLNSVDYEVTK